MQEWTFPSSSSSATYTARVNPDGRLSCDCRGWTMKKANKARSCKHTDKVVRDNALVVQEQGDYWYVVQGVTVHTAHASHAHSVTGKTLVANAGAALIKKAQAAAADAAHEQARLDAAARTQNVKGGYRPLMLADKLPDGKTIADYPASDWAMEQKFDGERVLTRVNGGFVSAWSRAGGGRDEGLPRALPPHIEVVAKTLPNGYYDGEIVVGTGKSNDVRRLTNHDKSTLVLFDALELVGDDITDLTYEQRHKSLIATTRLSSDGPVIVATTMNPSQEVYDALIAQGGEGVMLKRRDSTYVGRRSTDWVKVKTKSEAVCEIVGFESGESGPASVVLFRMPSGVESRAKTLNNAWHKRIASGDIRVGTKIEVEYQVLMASGKPRHPMIKRVAGEA